MGHQRTKISDEKNVFFFSPDFSDLACLKAYALIRTTSSTAKLLSNAKPVLNDLNEMGEGFAVRETRALGEILDEIFDAMRNMVAWRRDDFEGRNDIEEMKWRVGL